MNKMIEACKQCENICMCILNDFKNCPKIEVAADGLGVPYKPKANNECVRHIPFGVHQPLKDIVRKYK